MQTQTGSRTTVYDPSSAAGLADSPTQSWKRPFNFKNGVSKKRKLSSATT
jgi:hypothetical protein